MFIYRKLLVKNHGKNIKHSYELNCKTEVIFFISHCPAFSTIGRGKRNSVIIQLTVKVAFEIVPPAMMTP